MIKAIIANPAGRRFVTTAMFTTAVLGAGAVNLNTNANNIESMQTELVNKKTAQALKSNMVSLETFSFEKNRKLDKIYIKHCEEDKSLKSKKETLEAIYNVYGTFSGTVEIQRMVDDRFMEYAFRNYSEHFSILDSTRHKIKQIKEDFYEWRDNVFYSKMFVDEQKMYEEQEFPSAEKVISVIDSHVKKSEFFSKTDIEIFEKNSKWFVSKQEDKNSAQAKSELIAFKVHLLNALAFNKYFMDNKMPEKNVFLFYFDDNFVGGESCVKP